MLYRFGPAPPRPARHWVTPGSALSLWLVASCLLSFYIGHIAMFSDTYGPLGAVATVMLWFFVTVYAVLLGAELNAQFERMTAGGSVGQAVFVPQVV